MADHLKSLSWGILVGAVAGALVALPDPASPRQGLAKSDSKGSVSSTSAEKAAGADATTPSEIPIKGWWNVVKRACAGFSGDRVMANAAAMTFYVLLALFPAIAALISIYGLFADPVQIETQVESLGGVIPGGGVDILKSQIDALTSHGATALSWGVALGLVTSLWSANAGVKAFFDALNVVYHEDEKRGFIRLTLTSLAFTFGFTAFVVIALLSVVGVPVALNMLGLGAATDIILRVGRWVAMIVIVDVALATLYRFGPSRKRARWSWVSWGATFAALLWVCASILFSLYVEHFGSYNKTYGSLGAVVGFMTWIWLSSIIVLMGAEINAELEQQTERDSTVGREKPAGTRGAYKADVKT
jgi:membrane protein